MPRLVATSLAYQYPKKVEIREHLLITGTALKRWFMAQTYDALAVGLLWLVGLLLLGVPLAPMWALLGTLLQFLPHLGTMLALVGPAVTAAIASGPEGLLYVVILYALIVAIDGLLLQPYLMKRTARNPYLGFHTHSSGSGYFPECLGGLALDSAPRSDLCVPVTFPNARVGCEPVQLGGRGSHQLGEGGLHAVSGGGGNSVRPHRFRQVGSQPDKRHAPRGAGCVFQSPSRQPALGQTHCGPHSPGQSLYGECRGAPGIEQ